MAGMQRRRGRHVALARVAVTAVMATVLTGCLSYPGCSGQAPISTVWVHAGNSFPSAVRIVHLQICDAQQHCVNRRARLVRGKAPHSTRSDVVTFDGLSQVRIITGWYRQGPIANVPLAPLIITTSTATSSDQERAQRGMALSLQVEAHGMSFD